jgi:hypothetical protein
MLWYVAIVAVANLGLGYALAVYLGRKPVVTYPVDGEFEADLS